MGRLALALALGCPTAQATLVCSKRAFEQNRNSYAWGVGASGLTLATSAVLVAFDPKWSGKWLMTGAMAFPFFTGLQQAFRAPMMLNPPCEVVSEQVLQVSNPSDILRAYEGVDDFNHRAAFEYRGVAWALAGEAAVHVGLSFLPEKAGSRLAMRLMAAVPLGTLVWDLLEWRAKRRAFDQPSSLSWGILPSSEGGTFTVGYSF